MMCLTSGFKKFGCYCQLRKVVSLIVLIAFSSSVVSPAFADSIAPQDSATDASLYEEESACYGDECFQETPEEVLVVLEGSVKAQDQQAPVVSECEQNVGAEKVDLEQGDVLTEEEFVTIISPEGSSSDYIKFVLENQKLIWGPLYTEFTKKTGGRATRALAIPKEISKAYASIESTRFAAKGVSGIFSNIRKLVEAAKANGDYIKAGRLMRTAIVMQVLTSPLQYGAGCANGYAVKMLSDVPDVGLAVNAHARSGWNFATSLTGELSGGKLGEALLSIEDPENMYIPPLVNAVTSLVVMLPGIWLGNAEGVTEQAVHFARSEAAGAIASAATTIGMVYSNSDYDKYEIFNISDGLIDKEAFWDILDYGISPAFSSLMTTSGKILDLCMVAKVGEIALSVKRASYVSGLCINPFVTGTAIAVGAKVSKLRGANETEEEIRRAVIFGTVSVVGSSMLFFVPVAVVCGVGSPGCGMMFDMALADVALGWSRGAKEIGNAYGVKEQGVLKWAGDALTLGIPAGSLIICKILGIDAKQPGVYRIVSRLSNLPAVIYIFGVWYTVNTMR